MSRLASSESQRLRAQLGGNFVVTPGAVAIAQHDDGTPWPATEHTLRVRRWLRVGHHSTTPARLTCNIRATTTGHRRSQADRCGTDRHLSLWTSTEGAGQERASTALIMLRPEVRFFLAPPSTSPPVTGVIEESATPSVTRPSRSSRVGLTARACDRARLPREVMEP